MLKSDFFNVIKQRSLDFWAESIARSLVLIAIFFIPLSSATLRNLYIPAAFIALLSTSYRRRLVLVMHLKMNWFALILLGMFGIGVFYNPFGVRAGLSGFYKYAHHFIALFFVMPLFTEGKWRKIAINIFIISAVCSAIVYPFVFYYSPQYGQGYFQTLLVELFPSISYSIVLAFAAYLLMIEFVNDPHHRIWKGLALGILLFILYFFNIERTGMLVFLGLIVLFCWQKLGIKGIFLGIMLGIMLAGSSYTVSPSMKNRLQAVYVDIQQYSQNQRTSIGLRLDFLRYGTQLVKKNLWFGQGTGLYSEGVSNRVADATLDNGRINPENTYLHIALQIGAIGLSVFILWIIFQYRESLFLPFNERFQAQGLIIAMLMANCVVTAFSIGQSAVMYMLLLGILFAGQLDKQSSINR